jgi:tetratricopeptide (TPR) repeat protein
MADLLTFSTAWLPLLGAVAAAAIVQAAAAHWQRTLVQQGAVLPRCGMTGRAVARGLLAGCGLDKVQVLCTANDRYDSIRQEVELSSANHDGASLAAIAIAAHEVGHAEQYATGFWACRLKRLIGWLCFLLAGGCALLAIGAISTLPIAFLAAYVALAGTVSLGLQLALVLSLELDASRRARRLVQEAGWLASDEAAGFDRVLRAAVYTYAAAEARRWVFFVVAVVALVCLGSQLSSGDSAPPTVDEFEEPPLEPLAFLLEEVGRIVLMGGLCFLLWRFHSRRGRNDAERAIGHNNAGMARYERGEWAASLADFNAALQLDPQLATAWFNRGSAHLSLGQLDAALADFDATLKRHPGYVPAMSRRADVWLARGDLERALAEYNQALAADPAHAQALVGRGNIRLRQGNTPAAWEDLEQAIRVAPSDPLAYIGRATVGYVQQDFRRALDDLNVALTLGYRDADTHLLCGQCCLALEDYDHAIAHLSAAIEAAPARSSAWRDRGLAWLKQDRFEQALADLDEAIRLDPSDAVSFNNRGVVRMKTGETAQARADLEEAIRLDPDFPNPRKHLATL